MLGCLPNIGAYGVMKVRFRPVLAKGANKLPVCYDTRIAGGCWGGGNEV
jgi:hypothetical protein